MGKDDIENTKAFYFCMFSSSLSFPPNRHAITRIIFPSTLFLSADPLNLGRHIPQEDPSIPPSTGISPVSVSSATVLTLSWTLFPLQYCNLPLLFSRIIYLMPLLPLCINLNKPHSIPDQTKRQELAAYLRESVPHSQIFRAAIP